MNNSILKPRGDTFYNLTKTQQAEILQQMPAIVTDPNYTTYRFYRSPYHKWIICNAMTIPMKLNKVVWR